MTRPEKPQRQRIPEIVSKEIQEMILSTLNSGDKLPSEIEFASRYDVSRSSIREALQILEVIGIVEKRNGGTYVTSSPKECLVEPLSLMIQMNFAPLSDILEMHALLELETVRLATLNASVEDIRNLENLVWLMQKPDLEPDEYIELDKQFHCSVAEASGNAVLYHFIKDILVVVTNFTDRLCRATKNARDLAIPLHKKTLEGIINKNVDLALEGMTEHLALVDESIYEKYSIQGKKAVKT